MHHPDAAAQLLEDAGLGGDSPAAGAAVAAGIAAADRVVRPGILVVEVQLGEVQLVEVQPELVNGHLALPAPTEASRHLLNQILDRRCRVLGTGYSQGMVAWVPHGVDIVPTSGSWL
jgi:hypothetical protein